MLAEALEGEVEIYLEVARSEGEELEHALVVRNRSPKSACVGCCGLEASVLGSRLLIGETRSRE
jgi:hypothetical protein